MAYNVPGVPEVNRLFSAEIVSTPLQQELISKIVSTFARLIWVRRLPFAAEPGTPCCAQ